jgi:disulfide bond formation protein DsbB
LTEEERPALTDAAGLLGSRCLYYGRALSEKQCRSLSLPNILSERHQHPVAPSDIYHSIVIRAGWCISLRHLFVNPRASRGWILGRTAMGGKLCFDDCEFHENLVGGIHQLTPFQYFGSCGQRSEKVSFSTRCSRVILLASVLLCKQELYTFWTRHA